MGKYFPRVLAKIPKKHRIITGFKWERKKGNDFRYKITYCELNHKFKTPRHPKRERRHPKRHPKKHPKKERRHPKNPQEENPHLENPQEENPHLENPPLENPLEEDPHPDLLSAHSPLLSFQEP